MGLSGGAEVHGDGFKLYADGNGEWLEALSYDYFPLTRFVRTDEKFTWKTVREEGKQYLIENYPDGRERKWEIQRFDASGEIHIPEGESGGFYLPVKIGDLVLANHPMDTIVMLHAEKGKFSKNKRYDVYQGPGAEYGRSGGGKGVVSTNGAINCYGTHNGWLLIEYEISKNKHRYGWISLNALPSSQANAYDRLNFSKDKMSMHICGVLTQDAVLTDDPFYSKNAVKQLPAGTSVFMLMRDKDFLLVEGFLGKERFMGFVPAAAVDMKYGYAEKAVFSIDEAKTYAEADIYAAMEAVKDAVYEHFSGTGLLSVSYIEKESTDPTAWWQPEEENREGVKLFADLSSMNLYEFEIAAYGIAREYRFILYREKGGEWQVGNWGYE